MSCRIYVVLVALAAGPAGAQTCSVPQDLQRLAPAGPPAEAPYTTIRDQERPFAEIPLGIGHLHMKSDAAPADDAVLRTALPLSAEPGSPPWGAITRGWLVQPDARARALTPEAMIETGYEIPTFIVLEQRPDGWLRFRYGRAESETAWVHSCALGPLTFTPWSEWLLSPTISPLRFRAEEPHSLHASPNGGVTATISGDYHLEPLEVRGMWMRVRLKQPSDFCTPEKTPKTTEGWIEWSSVALGPLVWYPSRGC